MSSSIAPGLLVASPSLVCPFFGRSLVLMVEHDESGSFGLTLNKPSEVAFVDVLTQLGIRGLPSEASREVFSGGPVAEETGWLLFERGEEPPPGEYVEVGPTLGLTASSEVLRALASGALSARALFFLGYAGWGPGQLEHELREGSWLPAELSPELLFETPPEARWRAGLATLGIDPARVSSGAPASA